MFSIFCGSIIIFYFRAKLSKPPFKTVNSKSAITGASAIANDQPVTFKEKIKSSGYGNHEPPRKLFTPKTNMKSSSTKPKGSLAPIALLFILLSDNKVYMLSFFVSTTNLRSILKLIQDPSSDV